MRLPSQIGAHPADVSGIQEEMELLHGEWDGGGVTAVAFDGKRIASGGRDGCVKVWRLVFEDGERNAGSDKGSVRGSGEAARLELEASLPCGDEAIVSGLSLNGRQLWASCMDGNIRHWDAGKYSNATS